MATAATVSVQCYALDGSTPDGGERCTSTATTHLAERLTASSIQAIVCDDHLAIAVSNTEPGELVWHDLGEACAGASAARWTTREPGPGSFCQTAEDRREQQRNRDRVRNLDRDGGPTYGR